MSDWNTYGHEQVKRILDLQLQSGNLSHAYVFFGPEGIGKKMLAQEFAEKILRLSDTSHAPFASHPDAAILDGGAEITVEHMHIFMEGLSYKPFRAQKKVAIMNDAHLMNTQSSNALLKTLEEPSPSTIVILISTHKNLMPTILSRCQVFSFSSFTDTQMGAYLSQAGIQPPASQVLLSFGRIGRLLQLQDAAELAAEQKRIQQFTELKKNQIAERILAIKDFSELEVNDLQKLMTTWLLWQRQVINEDQRSYPIAHHVQESLRQLQTNKNKKLILQNLFLHI